MYLCDMKSTLYSKRLKETFYFILLMFMSLVNKHRLALGNSGWSTFKSIQYQHVESKAEPLNNEAFLPLLTTRGCIYLSKRVYIKM